jgi:uncharacterized protein YbjT (DUF2867 family)
LPKAQINIIIINMESNHFLVAGASGYLGRYITKELLSRNIKTRAIVRNINKLNITDTNLEVFEGQVTRPDSIKGVCSNIDIVISTLGITRQKDGLTYEDVDYKANLNILEEAKKAGVKKFVYISVLNGDKIRHLKGGAAKEKFCDALKVSGIDYCIVRPNGFFSDMGDFFNMARKGRIYLFRDGELKINPIHGADLAKAVVDVSFSDAREIKIGGPDLLSQNEIAELALKACGKKRRITHLPDWIRLAALFLLRRFSNEKFYGPLEFFMTTMVMDMTAPEYGTHRLEEYFDELAEQESDE